MPESVDEYRERQAAEWGQYVAVETIYHDGARAYNVGAAVPAANVKAHGYDKAGLVAKAGSKAAEAAAEPTGAASAGPKG